MSLNEYPPDEVATDAGDVADLLLAMELELRGLALWSVAPPSPEALASTAPFCYDTLRLEQWLQWVLLPKMKAILETGDEWPATSGIAPLAEEYFAALDIEAAKLLEIIEQFDTLISARGRRQARH